MTVQTKGVDLREDRSSGAFPLYLAFEEEAYVEVVAYSNWIAYLIAVIELEEDKIGRIAQFAQKFVVDEEVYFVEGKTVVACC